MKGGLAAGGGGDGRPGQVVATVTLGGTDQRPLAVVPLPALTHLEKNGILRMRPNSRYSRSHCSSGVKSDELPTKCVIPLQLSV